jgi:hypothetical protein
MRSESHNVVLMQNPDTVLLHSGLVGSLVVLRGSLHERNWGKGKKEI